MSRFGNPLILSVHQRRSIERAIVCLATIALVALAVWSASALIRWSTHPSSPAFGYRLPQTCDILVYKDGQKVCYYYGYTFDGSYSAGRAK